MSDLKDRGSHKREASEKQKEFEKLGKQQQETLEKKKRTAELAKRLNQMFTKAKLPDAKRVEGTPREPEPRAPPRFPSPVEEESLKTNIQDAGKNAADDAKWLKELVQQRESKRDMRGRDNMATIGRKPRPRNRNPE